MLFKDIRFALRMFARTPGLTAVAVLTLGLGLGMTMTVWGVIDRVLVDPLPYPDSDRIVELRMSEPGREMVGVPMSVFAYQDIVDQSRVLPIADRDLQRKHQPDRRQSPQRVRGARVSSSFFDVMGVPPRLGRGIRPEEDAVGGENVVVLAHGLWQSRYGGESDILGEKVMVNGRPHTVIGVAPEDFSYPRNVDVWLPISIDWAEEDRGHGWVVGFGRLAPGVTLSEARADLERISTWQQSEFPENHEGCTLIATPIKETIVGPVQSSLMVLLGAVCCVLLDCRLQRHHSAFGANGGSAAGSRPAPGVGRQPQPLGAAAHDREHLDCSRWGPRGHCFRPLGHRSGSAAICRVHSPV